MDWDSLLKIFGLPGAMLVAALVTGKLGWWDWARVNKDLREENQRLREEMAARDERHRNEMERRNELHRYENQRWIDMAIQNNVIAMRNAANVERAADVAEKVVEKVAPNSQQGPT